MDYRDYSILAMEHSGYICNIYDAQSYQILYMSKASMNLYGIEKTEDYQGKKCYQLFLDADAPCPNCPMQKLSEGQTNRWERYNEKFDRWFDSSDVMFRLNGRLCRLELTRDITMRKDQETLRAREFTMEDVLFRCLQTLMQEQDLQVAVNLFLEAICGYYHASRAYIFEYELKQQVANNTFEWCSPGETAYINELQEIPLHYFQCCNEAFERDGQFSASALTEKSCLHGEMKRVLESKGVQNTIAAALHRENQLAGFVGVDNPRRNAGNLTLLRSVAGFVLEELEKRRLILELENMSYTDALTGLQNRNHYHRMLRGFWSSTPEMLGVVSLDINGLKELNETFGLEYGDQIIRQVAKILQKHFSEGVHRVGSDEFVVLCTNVPKDVFKQKVVELRRAFNLEENFSVSIGFAWRFDEDTVDVKTLLQQAEEMRDAEKQAHYHSVLNHGYSLSHGGFLGEILRELEEKRFVVYYQPQVNLQTGEVIGAEALVRKKNDDGSFVAPGDFVPFYEVGGVIRYVDLFVLRTACRALHKWHEQGYDLHISVNFSRVTLLEPNIVDEIRAICCEEEVSPASITVEVTERIGEMDSDRLKELVQKLKLAGFSISLDDFGAQYSNLGILSTLDFDEIKLDRGLVSALEENAKSRLVMESTLRLCRSLEGTASLAEGIETKGQRDILAEYHCNYGQGYYFSRPIPQEEFERFLMEQKQKAR